MISDYGKAIAGIRARSRDYFKSNNLNAVVLGISGGIDSALCAALLEPVCWDLGMNVIGRSYPTGTNKNDEISRARLCGNAFCTDFQEISISAEFDILSKEIESSENIILHPDKLAIPRCNRKARLRMIRLYELAGLNNGLVISTDNLTEYYLGFWTINGDVGDFSPIQMCWKTEVYKMCEYLVNEWQGNPKNQKKILAMQPSITADPTDGNGVSTTDLDQIWPGWQSTFKTTREAYEAVDKILIDHSPENHPVMTRHNNTAYKRNIPIVVPRNAFTDDPCLID